MRGGGALRGQARQCTGSGSACGACQWLWTVHVSLDEEEVTAFNKLRRLYKRSDVGKHLQIILFCIS